MNKKGNNPWMIIGVLALILLIGGGITGFSIWGNDRNDDPIPKKISQLPSINLSDVKSYENYKEFADRTNDLVSILNEQSGFKIPLLSTTQEAWEEASKKITKYGPLINNYQEVNSNAKMFETNGSEENYKSFYSSVGKFSFELSIISLAVFHKATFEGIGILYRNSGLNSVALKCPSCVSVILSDAYWIVNTVLVEESSKIAKEIIDQIGRFGK